MLVLADFSFKSENRLVDTNGRFKSLEINKHPANKRRGSAPDTSVDEVSETRTPKSTVPKKKKSPRTSGNSYSLKNSTDSYPQRFTDLKTPQGSTISKLSDYYPIYTMKPLPQLPVCF